MEGCFFSFFLKDLFKKKKSIAQVNANLRKWGTLCSYLFSTIVYQSVSYCSLELSLFALALGSIFFMMEADWNQLEF